VGPALPEHPEPELASYRPLSVLAMVALGLGLLSVTALPYPVLLTIPVSGVVVAVLAMWRIDRAEQPMLGRRLAVAGLWLSVVYLIAAPTSWLTREYWLTTRAKHLAEEFLDLVQTEPARAYRLMYRSHEKRPPPPTGPHGEKPEPAEKPKSDFEQFLDDKVVATLIRLGAKQRRQFIHREVVPEQGGRQSIYVTYDITDAADPQRPPMHTLFITERNTLRDEHWLIMSINKLPTSPVEE